MGGGGDFGFPEGEDHPRWNDDIGYEGAHGRIYGKRERTGICEHCGEAPEPTTSHTGRTVSGTDFALIHGRGCPFRTGRGELKPASLDPDDYIELCRPCHKKYDAQMEAS